MAYPPPVPEVLTKLERQRRAQLRGLLIIGAVVLLVLLFRGRHLNLFPPHWYRP